MLSRSLALTFILSLVLTQTACGWQAIPQAENNVEAAYSEVTSQYKRRADLIPNLVATVQGYAKHENKTLTEVTEARAKATSINLDPSKATPEQIAAYQNAQGQLSQALGKLLSITERYPDLKADEQFKGLQAQLEGTENRITVARGRLIETIKDFNNLVTVPPTSWTNSILYKKEKRAQWDVAQAEREKIETAPSVKF